MSKVEDNLIAKIAKRFDGLDNIDSAFIRELNLSADDITCLWKEVANILNAYLRLKQLERLTLIEGPNSFLDEIEKREVAFIKKIKAAFWMISVNDAENIEMTACFVKKWNALGAFVVKEETVHGLYWKVTSAGIAYLKAKLEIYCEVHVG